MVAAIVWGLKMKLLFILGDGAVGKMTVGQELAKITDLRLFHNHMTIELVYEVFGEYLPKTIDRLRNVIFEDFAETDNYGMIFTLVMAFDQQLDWEYVANIADIFKKHDGEIFYVELVAPLEVRLERNATENRLEHKPSKRNLEMSNGFLFHDYRCVSNEGEIPFENYIKIDNTHLLPEEVAQIIKEKFNL